MDVTLDCPICNTQNLKPAGDAYQCNNCGMATDASFKGLTTESEQYLAIEDTLKEFVQFINDSMWIPSQVQFEGGGISPCNIEGKLHYSAVFGEKELVSETFSEVMGFVIEQFHG